MLNQLLSGRERQRIGNYSPEAFRYLWAEMTSGDGGGCTPEGQTNDAGKGDNPAARLPYILIVDDDESFGCMLERTIANLTDYGCLHVKDANQALKILEERGADVVITDIRMPGMNGLDLTTYIKGNYDADIIVVTGYEEDFFYENAIEHGASDFIEKPIQPTELILRLQRVLRERESSANLRLAEERLQALKKRALDLEHTNDELESFSYCVSHDLREPLRIIESYSRMLVKNFQDTPDESTLHKIGVIRARAKQMYRLIDDILAFSRLGRQALVIAALDMEKLAAEVWDEFREQALQRNVKLSISKLRANCPGDYNMMRQVLANLFSNALKFTRERESATIEVGGYEKQDECVYYVKDNGIGFDMLYADKLFKILQRLHDENKYEGTGVGLSFVKRIIERHGGRVWAEGKVNEGATFYFTLPKPIPALSSSL